VRQPDYVLEVPIRHQGGDRSEGLDVVNVFRPPGIVRAEQQRRDEGAALRPLADRVDRLQVAKHQPRFAPDLARFGAHIGELGESRPAMNRTDSCWIGGWACSFIAVCAEPVKETTSWQVRWSSRSPVEPRISCKPPGGSTPASIRMRNACSATWPVEKAGFTI